MDYEQINIIRKYPFTEMAYLTSFLDNGIVNPININKLKNYIIQCCIDMLIQY